MRKLSELLSDLTELENQYNMQLWKSVIIKHMFLKI